MQTGTTVKKNLDYFKDLANRVSIRENTPKNHYRLLMEELLGFSLDNKIISTSEHTAYFSLSSTISFIVPFSAVSVHENLGLDLLILPGSLVPISNSHYPRGILLNNAEDRINFFARKLKQDSPLLLPPKSNWEIQDSLERKGYSDFTPYLCSDESFENYAFQLSRQMELIYQGIFEDENIPELKVHPVEEISSKMLLKLLEEHDPFIDALLFNKRNRERVLRDLTGVKCAWDTDGYGSFLFWARIPGTNRLSKLLYNSDRDTLYNDHLSVDISRESIMENMKQGKLFPGVYLALTMVSYLPNIPVIGGPKQLKYLTSMIQGSNSLEIHHRSEELSNLGYMDFVSENMRNEIPTKGASAYLLRNKLSVSEIINYLKNV